MTKIKRLDDMMLEPCVEFFNIREIPAAITLEHADNIRFWFYLRNATIFYGDGHHDSADNIRYRRKLKTEHLSDIGYST